MTDDHEAARQALAERLFREAEAMPIPRKPPDRAAAKRVAAIKAGIKAKRRRKRP